MSRSASNTKERFANFLYEGQRIQFSLKMNCQLFLFLVLLCMTHINLGLGDNLFLRDFLVTKTAFLDYIILEKMKQGLGKIITWCSKFCFSAHLFPSFYCLLFFIIINLSIFPSFSFYFYFFFLSFCSLFLENVKCCSKFPHCNATWLQVSLKALYHQLNNTKIHCG